MTARLLLALFLALLSTATQAASSAQMLTPQNTSVLGGETRTYSVRFFDAFGQPSVGETVVFSNDACGFFQNGLLTVSVLTDTTGVASVTFKARPLGIGCWITASAGVSVRFNVFTYTLAQVSIDAWRTPSNAGPGEDYTLSARAVTGAYPIYDANIDVKIVPGTASATIAPGRANSGRMGRVSFEVSNVGIGDYEIELDYRGVKHRMLVRGSESPLTDMWWAGPEENGWGMSIVQHRDQFFSVIYTYDDAGKPIWYVMPGGEWSPGQFPYYYGPLYVPRGAPYSAYDATQLVPGQAVGTAYLRFSGFESLHLQYTIGASSQSHAITRQPFGVPSASPVLIGLGDMWWGGPAQNGWGIAIIQQLGTLFCVWFTYDASGAPTWFVMPGGSWTDFSTYEGRLFRTTGSPWLGKPYDPSLLKPIDVGSFRFRFDGDNATFDYTIDGKPGTASLTRQGF